MKYFLFVTLLILFASCSPPTKQEAIDYYITIRYVESLDIMTRLDDQYLTVHGYFNDPKKLVTGPNDEQFELLISEQKKLVPNVRKCIKSLEKIDVLGDEAEILENLKLYLYHRIRFEEEVMTRLVKSLEDGMTSEESAFLQTRFTQLFDMIKQQDKFLKAENEFLKEFQISDDEIDNELVKLGY